MIRVLACYGTRPEAIKLQSLLWAAEENPDIDLTLVAVGQHTDLLKQVDETFGTSPNKYLHLDRERSSLNSLIASVVDRMDSLLSEDLPDVLLIQGDTSTALSASIAAFNLGIPVVHLEAGLRSGDLSNPYPEEGNRKMISAIAGLHLAPTTLAVNRLIDETVDPSRIAMVGNTVVDSALWALRQPPTLTGPLGDLVQSGEGYIVVTLHRRESWGDTFDGLLEALKRVAVARPAVPIVFCMHANPVLRQLIESAFDDVPNILLSGPLNYVSFMQLMAHSSFIISDSGGVQEEAPSFQRRVLLLREVTERPEAMESGHVELIGRVPDEIFLAALDLIDHPERRFIDSPNPFGDGRAGEKSLMAINKMFG